MARVAYSNWRDEQRQTNNENIAYSKPDKKGRTFVVSKRNTKGMRGKQDQVSMSVRDSKGNIEDHGSHINVKGAKKYATSRGYNMGEGAARDREERVYGSGASRDMNHGVEREIKPGKSSRRLKPPPAPPKGYEEKHPLSQKDRATIRNKLGQKKYPQTEEVSWEEAQYWSEDTVAAFLKRGGKITKVKPRVARGATKKKTIRLRGSTKSTADRGRKAEKKVHGEEVEEIDEISRETKDRYLKAASKDLIKQKERSNTIWWKKDNFRGGKTPIARSQDSVAAAKRKVKNRVRGIRRAADTVTIRKEDVIDEGGMGNNTKRPMSAAQKARHEKHQKLLKVAGAKKSKAPRKKARGKTEISKTASRYEEEYSLEEARRLTAAQRFLKKKAEKAAEDSPEEDRYREPTKKHVRDANWKEYAISRTTGKPGAKPRLVRGGGKSDTQKTLDKIESVDWSPKAKDLSKGRKPRHDFDTMIDDIKKSNAIRRAIADMKKERESKQGKERKRSLARHGHVTSEYTPDHGEAIDEAKMKVILKRVIRGASPFTIVALKNGRAIDQEHAKISQAVPAFVREMKKKHPNARISVEDRTGRVLHTEEYIDEGGMGGRHFKVKGGSIPSNAEIKAFYEKQKGSPSQRIAATKNHFGLQKMTVSARGIVSAKGIREAVSVDGRTRDYRGTRTRLESKGRRLGAGLDGRTKGYRDAYARTMARQQRAAADAAMMEPTEDTSTEIEEMQKGSNQSPVDASTASSNLKYKSGSRHATGTSKRPEKKRASKAARQLDKEDLKDLMHKKDLDNRHRRREDKAARKDCKEASEVLGLKVR